MKITTTLYKVGTKLRDGTTIDQKQMEQMVESFNNNLQDIRKTGASHYGMSGDHITHKIENVYVEGDSITADLEILDTPRGQEVMKLLEADAVKPVLEFIDNNGHLSIHTVSLNRK